MATPRNQPAQGWTIQQEMGFRTRTLNYRVGAAGIVGLQAAYAGGEWMTRYFNLMRPISGKHLLTPITDITPNMCCMRMPEYNVFICCGITTPAQSKLLAEGGFNVKPTYNIPGMVFSACWDITDACISFIRQSFTSIDPNRKWLLFGHSMGSSLVQLTTARLLKQFSVPANNIIGCWGFAGPKPGDPTFSNWLSQQVPCQSVHALGDPVPSLPPPGSNFLWSVADTLTSPFIGGGPTLSFDYAHVPSIWHLQPDGILETTDGAAAALKLTRSQLQGIAAIFTGAEGNTLQRHSANNYANSLHAAGGDWSNSQRLIALSGQISEANVKVEDATQAPQYPPPAPPATPTPISVTPPVIQQFNPVLVNPALASTGTPAPTRVAGTIFIAPVALNTTTLQPRINHLYEGYDRRLLETVQSSIKNIRQQDGKKMMAGDTGHIIFPNDETAVALATLSGRVDQLLSL